MWALYILLQVSVDPTQQASYVGGGVSPQFPEERWRARLDLPLCFQHLPLKDLFLPICSSCILPQVRAI